MKRTERGITLIALIITIAVMLILAGVSLQVALQGELFDVTGNAVGQLDKKWQNETKISEGKVTIDNTTYNSAGEYIESLGLNGENTQIEAKPTIVAGQKATENSNYTSGTKTAVIPGGFTVSGKASESTIDGGLVIYLIDDGTDISTINWNDSTTVDNLQRTYDQFVWIPIDDINDMYICQAKNGTNGACNITVNEAGKAECQTHKEVDSEKAIQMAGYLYIDYAMTERVTKYTPNEDLREPDVVTDYDEDSINLSQLTNILYQVSEPELRYDTASEFKERLQEEYNEIVKSVYKNKGFYVGRYETSGMVDSDTIATIKVVAGTTDGIGDVNWYRMYAQAKQYAKNKSLTTVVGSTMIQGTAYDQVMKFVNTESYNVATAGNVDHDLDDIYQTGGRNYTGTVVYNDCVKNIYDLEGNVGAWTTEAIDSSMRVFRGGVYYYRYPAIQRNLIAPNSCGNIIGMIEQLYVK